MPVNGWIGVDLDGTLAIYDGWHGPTHIGEPIQIMVDRIKDWLEEGIEVRIVTARMAGQSAPGHMTPEEMREVIQEWLVDVCDLPRLKCTCSKDYGMLQLWDDRAVQVHPNTGKPVGEYHDREHFGHAD
jgi:hypothetical protein